MYERVKIFSSKSIRQVEKYANKFSKDMLADIINASLSVTANGENGENRYYLSIVYKPLLPKE